MFRAITFPVTGPVGRDWTALRVALASCWTQSTALANWGSFIAMSVFNPEFLPPLKEAHRHAYYLYHSPDDRVCLYHMAEQAKKSLTANGATVHLATYQGGHGWRGNVYKDVRSGIGWLEKTQEKASSP